jgi:hypothetical protein
MREQSSFMASQKVKWNSSRTATTASNCRTGRWLWTASLPSFRRTRAFANTASPVACLKVGSWSSALRFS